MEAEVGGPQKRVLDALGNGGIEGCEPPCRCSKWTPGHLPEQVLLAAEASLQIFKLLCKQSDRDRVCCSIGYGARKGKISDRKKDKGIQVMRDTDFQKVETKEV